MNMKTLLLTGALTLALIPGLSAAEALLHYESQPTGNEMKLQGSAPLHDWECISKIISGYFDVEPAWQTDLSLKSVTCLGEGKTPPKCEINIPVRTLKSHVSVAASAMDNRLRTEMNAKTYPNISYKLTEMSIKGDVPASGSPVTFDTKGLLIVSGHTNKVSFPVTMERVGSDTLKWAGTLNTTFTACGLKPPEFSLVVTTIKTEDTHQADLDLGLDLEEVIAVAVIGGICPAGVRPSPPAFS